MSHNNSCSSASSAPHILHVTSSILLASKGSMLGSMHTRWLYPATLALQQQHTLRFDCFDTHDAWLGFWLQGAVLVVLLQVHKVPAIKVCYFDLYPDDLTCM
eukprot:GHRR01027695.1.p4 GENE.GHRR01027695.1~~GHRR01027695.1.p4  ORF type:complete len:102 (-),score=23.80 GHRR01027695.1:716-1021(-)